MSNGVCLSHGGTNAQLDVACIASTLAGAWSADATQSTVIVVKEYGLKLCESAFDARLAVEGFGHTSGAREG